MSSMIPETSTTPTPRPDGPLDAQSSVASLIASQIANGFGRARSQADAFRGTVARKAREAATHTDEAVHQHPYRAMGIAAAAALLAGILAARR